MMRSCAWRVRLPIVALAAATGLAGLTKPAQAVMRSPNGLGQVLLFPYYTTQGGNDTLISIVNTSDRGKALKFRVLEARNGRPVLDMHLYLGAYDVWTAAIGHAGDLGSGLTTSDQSCTVPDIVRGGFGFVDDALQALPDGRYFAPFTNSAYTGVAQDHSIQASATLGSLERTREGHIEVIEMADVIPGSALDRWLMQGVATSDCLAVNQAWLADSGAFVANPGFGLQAPTGVGALYGNALIVHPARGTVLGYGAEALVGFNHRVLHAPPGDDQPGLHSVNDPGPEGQGRATAQVFHDAGIVHATYSDSGTFRKVDAISALFATLQVSNDYYLDQTEAVTGNSEWVLNFPTRRYYVDSRPTLPDGAAFLAPFGSSRPPFVVGFADQGSAVLSQIQVFDREQGMVLLPPIGGCGIPCPPGLSPRAARWQTQVIAFGQSDRWVQQLPSAVLGAPNYMSPSIHPTMAHGWAALEFVRTPAEPEAQLPPSDEGLVFHGLPVIGFMVVNYDNAGFGEVLANYSALFRHRTTPTCSNAELEPCW